MINTYIKGDARVEAVFGNGTLVTAYGYTDDGEGIFDIGPRNEPGEIGELCDDYDMEKNAVIRLVFKNRDAVEHLIVDLVDLKRTLEGREKED